MVGKAVFLVSFSPYGYEGRHVQPSVIFARHLGPHETYIVNCCVPSGGRC